MKIRIKGNSLRLRLSKTAISQLKQKGIVSQQISFGGNMLTYQLKIDKAITQVQADYINNVISVNIPNELAAKWTDTEMVGFDEEVKYGNGQSISVLVEKDFQCLTAREGEDETDLFTNPQMIE
ncbi:MAG TPA: hypothetical protein PKL31_16910 [Fulvivirga sp.]|nr:hypothetical protein [Fulvivirga sp.]